jgi:excinuclease ABC subunit A
VLDMTVDEACEFFKAVPVIRDKLLTLCSRSVSATSISASRRRRCRAARRSGSSSPRSFHAAPPAARSTSSTSRPPGLHFEDVRKLLEVLHRLVETGNTVLVIEHNLEVIKTADWVIDMGPDGGSGGGRLVAEGPPEAIVKVPDSYTGQYLARLLPRSSTAKKRA